MTENIRTRFLFSAKNMERAINRALKKKALYFRLEADQILFINEKDEVVSIQISGNKREVIECEFQKYKWLQIKNVMSKCQEQPVAMVIEQTSHDTCEFTLTYTI